MPYLMRITKTVETQVSGIGVQIKQARKAIAGYKSVRQLCEEVGISRAFWYSIENDNDNKEISVELETLRKIEKALDIDLGVEIPH